MTRNILENTMGLVKNNFIALICSYNPIEFHIVEQVKSIVQNGIRVVIVDFSHEYNSLEYFQNSSITYVHKPGRLGPMISFYEGMKYVIDSFDFDYLYLCDQDDVWHSEKHVVVSNYLNSVESCYVLGHDVQCFNDNDGKSIGAYSALKSRRYPIELSRDLSLTANAVVGHSLCLRKEFIRDFLNWNGKKYFLMHDWAILYYSNLKYGGINWLGLCLSYYRIHNNNILGLNQKESGKMSYIKRHIKYVLKVTQVISQLEQSYFKRVQLAVKRIWLASSVTTKRAFLEMEILIFTLIGK